MGVFAPDSWHDSWVIKYEFKTLIKGNTVGISKNHQTQEKSLQLTARGLGENDSCYMGQNLNNWKCGLWFAIISARKLSQKFLVIFQIAKLSSSCSSSQIQLNWDSPIISLRPPHPPQERYFQFTQKAEIWYASYFYKY